MSTMPVGFPAHDLRHCIAIIAALALHSSLSAHARFEFTTLPPATAASDAGDPLSANSGAIGVSGDADGADGTGASGSSPSVSESAAMDGFAR